LEGTPPAEHPNYQRVNRRLRSIFALSAWPNALRRGKVQALGLPDVVKADTELSELKFTFGGCKEATDDSLHAMISNLPLQLQKVTLDLGFCINVTDASAKNLGMVMGDLPALTHLSINLAGCASIGDSGLQDLATGLSRAARLQALSLDLANYGDASIGDAGLQHLSKGIVALKQLRSIYLNLCMCKSITDAGVEALGSGLAQLPLLQHVELNLDTCDIVGDLGATALASGLSGLQQLESFKLSMHRSAVGDDGAIALVDSLEGLKTLDRVHLNLASTKIADAGVKKLYLAFRNLPEGHLGTSYPAPSRVELFGEWNAELSEAKSS